MKRILAVVLVALICVSVCACGPGEEPHTPSPAEKEPVLTEINHYVLNPGDRCYLTDARMEAYQKAVDAMLAHEPEVRLTDSYDDNLAVLGYLQQSPYSFILSDYDITPDHKGIRFQYQYPAEDCAEKVNSIDREYLSLINENIAPDMTDLEKILAIHKYFAERISYDYDWLDALNMSDDKYLFPHIAVYQALSTNKGVCHTYTYLCEFALQQLGIDCVRATADRMDSDSGHMWLLVWVNGTAFHVDPTWDDEGDGVCLRYFGMTDEENLARGMVNNWSVSIDSALSIRCADDRFASWRDITDYRLIGNHQMQAVRSDGSTEVIDLTQYQ